jgi:hypothetical protein
LSIRKSPNTIGNATSVEYAKTTVQFCYPKMYSYTYNPIVFFHPKSHGQLVYYKIKEQFSEKCEQANFFSPCVTCLLDKLEMKQLSDRPPLLDRQLGQQLVSLQYRKAGLFCAAPEQAHA